MRRIFSILSILFCILFVAADDELVESAIYQSWNRHDLGTSVTRDAKVNIAGQLMTARFVSKLVAKAENAVSLDEETETSYMGKKQSQTSEKYVSARVKKGREEMPESYEGVMTNVGSDSLKIEGRNYECRVLSFDGYSPQGKTLAKFWMNDDVPGLVVKAQIKISARQGEMDIEMILVTFETK